MARHKIDRDKCEKVIDALMPLPKSGTQAWEDMVDFMRADIELNEQKAKIEMLARKIVKDDGRDFDEEFAKWRKENPNVKGSITLADRG